MSALVVDVVAGLASFATVACVVPLIIATARRQTYPSPVTWGTWAAVGIVAGVAMARADAPWPAWTLKLALALGPLGVCAVALVARVPWVRDPWETVALALGTVGVALYVLTGADESTIAILTAIGVDAIGGVPTLRRAWRSPHGELVRTYVIALVALLATLAILPRPWTFTGTAALLFVGAQMIAIITVFLLARRRPDVALVASPGRNPA